MLLAVVLLFAVPVASGKPGAKQEGPAQGASGAAPAGKPKSSGPSASAPTSRAPDVRAPRNDPNAGPQAASRAPSPNGSGQAPPGRAPRPGGSAQPGPDQSAKPPQAPPPARAKQPRSSEGRPAGPVRAAPTPRSAPDPVREATTPQAQPDSAGRSGASRRATDSARSRPAATAPRVSPRTAVVPARATATPTPIRTRAATQGAPTAQQATRAQQATPAQRAAPTRRTAAQTGRTAAQTRLAAAQSAAAARPAPSRGALADGLIESTQGPLPAAAAFGLLTTTGIPTEPARTTPASTGSRTEEPRDAGSAESPLGRTVVRVLEVVPDQMRIALAALAGLGLLLGAAVAVQTVRGRRLARQRRLLLADVGVLQSALLPVLPERIGGARLTVAYRPAGGLAAGGDFYDAFALHGERTAVLVGDIAGHGREVVPLTALVRYNVRAYLEAGLSPRATIHVAANVLAPHLGDRTVTLVVAVFDPGTGRLTYASAGHAPPLLLESTVVPVTACSSPPINAGAPTGRRQTTLPLTEGAVACLYTDGLDEAPVPSGRLGRDGLHEELRAIGPPHDAAELVSRIARRSERRHDDMAACVLTVLAGAADAGSLRVEELEVDRAALTGGWAERFLLACDVGRPRIAKALRVADAIIARNGTAVIEVGMEDGRVDVWVGPPLAVTLPVAGRTSDASAAAATS